MREILKGRPLLVFAIGTACGLASQEQPILMALAAILALTLTTWSSRACLLIAALVGLLFAPSFNNESPDHFSGEGIVVTVPRIGKDNSSTCLIRTAKGLFLLKSNYTYLSLYDRLQIKGDLKPVSGFQNDYWKQRGVNARFENRTVSIASVEPGPGIFRLGLAWRDSFMHFTRSSLDPEDASMIDALCFNADAALDPDIRNSLRRAGTIHIISASGLHVTLFAGALLATIAIFPIPRPLQLLVVSLILLAYGGAAGMRPPIIRSVLMCWIAIWAYTGRREYDGLSALGFCALVQFLIDRYSIFDPSFQLSYGIMLALALFPFYSPEKGLWKWINSELKASLIATVSASPLLAYWFGQISIISIVSNILVAPIMGVLIGGALFSWLVSLFHFETGSKLLYVSKLLSDWISMVSNALGNLPFAAVDVPHFPAVLVFLTYAALLLGFWKFVPRPAE